MPQFILNCGYTAGRVSAGEEDYMKWYKHLAKSIDNPFIRQLMYEFGSDAYLVFFGILEIYSDNFSPKNDWKLTINLRYFHEKFLLSKSKIKNILSKISEWEVTFISDDVVIFIPKFKELLDNYTKDTNPKNKNKLASDLQETFQPIRIKNKDKRIKKENKEKEYSLEFESFYSIYQNKKDKPEAYKAWQKRNGLRPDIEIILKAVQDQINWRNNASGEFRPEWKNPATWLNKGSWTDEIPKPHPLAGKVSDTTIQNIESFNNWRPPV